MGEIKVKKKHLNDIIFRRDKEKVYKLNLTFAFSNFDFS